MSKHKVGDVVMLRNGTLPMCVEKIYLERIVCTWFDAENQLHRNDFDTNDLESVKVES